jgi:hypothetical protein
MQGHEETRASEHALPAPATRWGRWRRSPRNHSIMVIDMSLQNCHNTRIIAFKIGQTQLSPCMQNIHWVEKGSCRPASTWTRICQSIHGHVVCQRPSPRPASVIHRRLSPCMQKINWVGKGSCRPASTWTRIYQSIHAHVMRQRPSPRSASVTRRRRDGEDGGGRRIITISW